MADIIIKQSLLPNSKYPNKSPFEMKPIGLTIHETDNGATAVEEIAYMTRESNNRQVSYHFAVDDKDIIQGLPLDRNGWHAGDGKNGKGNRQTIAIEICGNYSRHAHDLHQPKPWYPQARANAEKLAGYLLWKYNWTDKDMYRHYDWSGKNCPRVIIREKRWEEFKKNAMAWKAKFAGETKPAPVAPKPDSKKVTVNGVPHVNSAGDKPGAKLVNYSGEISIEAPGAKFPYHIKGKGWVNAAAIGAKPVTTEIKVGSKVVANGYPYANSAGSGKGAKLTNYSGTINYLAPGAKYPYHVSGKGWMSADSIGVAASGGASTPSKPASPSKPSAPKVGDTVSVNGRLYGTSDGSKPGANMKGNGVIEYYIAGKKYPYHIKNKGWVSAAAIGAATSTAIKVGDKVLVKTGAKAYTGAKVTSAWYRTPKVVSEISGNRVLLDAKGWNTPFHIKDLKKA